MAHGIRVRIMNIMRNGRLMIDVSNLTTHSIKIKCGTAMMTNDRRYVTEKLSIAKTSCIRKQCSACSTQKQMNASIVPDMLISRKPIENGTDGKQRNVDKKNAQVACIGMCPPHKYDNHGKTAPHTDVSGNPHEGVINPCKDKESGNPHEGVVNPCKDKESGNPRKGTNPCKDKKHDDKEPEMGIARNIYNKGDHDPGHTHMKRHTHVNVVEGNGEEGTTLSANVGQGKSNCTAAANCSPSNKSGKIKSRPPDGTPTQPHEKQEGQQIPVSNSSHTNTIHEYMETLTPTVNTQHNSNPTHVGSSVASHTFTPASVEPRQGNDGQVLQHGSDAVAHPIETSVEVASNVTAVEKLNVK
jgi:hypothetical protein